jgi:2,3-bisphosphoglycerate-independent phosphoglycerate mutase
MGAGRIYKQGAGLVDSALADGSMFTGGWKKIQEAVEKGGTLHLLGLLSDGGVHSRLDQVSWMIALDQGCK